MYDIRDIIEGRFTVKILKRVMLWLSIMLVLEVIINAAGAVIAKNFSVRMMEDSLVGYSQRSTDMIRPHKAESGNSRKNNGLARLSIRSMLSDGRLYTDSQFRGNFIFINQTIEETRIFFDENGTTPLSEGIFAVVYKDVEGTSVNYMKNAEGVIDINELCKLDGAKELYDCLGKCIGETVRLDAFSVDESYVVHPAEMTVLDSAGSGLLHIEFPCDGEIIKGSDYYIYEETEKEDDKRNSSTCLYKKMSDVYKGELKGAKTARKLMETADFSQSEQRWTERSYGFAYVTSKHVETTDGGAMVCVVHFSYIGGVLLYTVICAVVLTVIFWIVHINRRDPDYYY